MKDLEFTCTQKCARYEDGWDRPESLADATDSSGNIYNCCECDCDTDCCCDEENCGCVCGDDNHCEDDGNGNGGDDGNENQRDLVCSIFEKTCSCEESRGPSNANDETGWHKSCTTSIRIVKKYQRGTNQ